MAHRITFGWSRRWPWRNGRSQPKGVVRPGEHQSEGKIDVGEQHEDEPDFVAIGTEESIRPTRPGDARFVSNQKLRRSAARVRSIADTIQLAVTSAPGRFGSSRRSSAPMMSALTDSTSGPTNTDDAVVFPARSVRQVSTPLESGPSRLRPLNYLWSRRKRSSSAARASPVGRLPYSSVSEPLATTSGPSSVSSSSSSPSSWLSSSWRT